MISPKKAFDPTHVVKISHGCVWVKFLYFGFHDIQSGAVVQVLLDAVDRGIITLNDLKTKRIVLDSLCEGQGRPELAEVIETLSTQDWFDHDRLIFLSNVSDDLSDIVKTVNWPTYMTNHSTWLDHFKSQNIDFDNLQRDRHFICLIRRRSDLRSQLVGRILKKYHPEQYLLSYASMIDYNCHDPIADTQIPILLDGPTPGNEQHRLTDKRVYQGIIDVIAETSNQESLSWTSRFITEKTFKCFAWHQVPIWWTIPGFVADVRSQDFDVFDDIMDGHKYDMITDPKRRLDKLLETLDSAILKIQSVGIQQFHEQHRERFEKNWQHLLNIESRRLGYWPEIINRVRTI